MRRLALAWPTLRAARRAPLLGAMAAGLAIVAVPAALPVTFTADNLAVLLRLGMACAAVGLAFLFDDPAKPTIATAPVPAWQGIAVRTVVAATAMTAWWAAAIGVTLAGAEGDTADPLPCRAWRSRRRPSARSPSPRPSSPGGSPRAAPPARPPRPPCWSSSACSRSPRRGPRCSSSSPAPSGPSPINAWRS
ncbi:hypothetical protein OHA72_14330 [Dactylosporangium sp. NBC_01737]|uniref:hypothetical protein n=1 Tax=Dactylosporangium sp. NBC_01737 TaxID=2975959 RepID=UPI002E0E4885|nr:hypothetical protein OHA72_14330 [Dactylosporangium sp. NBC_01737]